MGSNTNHGSLPSPRALGARLSRRAERPVTRAFAALVQRQARRGRLSRDVQAAIAESLVAATEAGAIQRRGPLRAAVRQSARSLGLTGVQGAADSALTDKQERQLAKMLNRLQVVTQDNRARRSSPAVRAMIRSFHRLFYADRGTWHKTTWQGIKTLKCPLDLWLYQEIVHQVKPGLIVETGTAYGGSASYLAWLCDIVGSGRIVSVDLAPYADTLPKHPRVTYLRGSSTDPDIVAQVKAMAVPGEPVLVILDSDHSEAHVRDELAAYSDLVTPGSYLIVEDTDVNGHPVHPGHGPGPMEALNGFLAETSEFVIDRRMHRYHMTLNPRGYLRRVEPAAG